METHFSLLCRRVWLAVGCVLAVLGGAQPASAQIQMELSLHRRSFITCEPLVATVTIVNQAGRDVTFEDVGGKQWFNVEVNTQDGGIIQPNDPDYKLQPLTVQAGQTVKRQIDLTPLFPIRDMGSYHIRANVYLADVDRFFTSNYVTFDITDGKLIWRQDAGVPGTGAVRQVSLLTFQLVDRLMLYARVKDEDDRVVYTTQALGRLILNGREPEAVFDKENTLHVLHEAVPGTFLYTEISLDGERLLQQAYAKVNGSRPGLYKSADGSVNVRGGQIQVAAARSVPGAAREPKLSDRPSGMPAPPKNPDWR